MTARQIKQTLARGGRVFGTFIHYSTNPMIESVAALESLDALCSVPGIDAVFIGPNDMTNSLGIPEQRDDPKFVEAVQRVIDAAERHGIAAGAHFSSIAHARRLIEQGARFIPFGNDGKFIQAGVEGFLADLRGHVGQAADRAV